MCVWPEKPESQTKSALLGFFVYVAYVRKPPNRAEPPRARTCPETGFERIGKSGGWVGKRARETRPPNLPKCPVLVPVARSGKVRHAILPLGRGRPALKMHGRLLAKLGVSNSAHHCGNSLEFTQHRPAYNAYSRARCSLVRVRLA